jgi:hypothetical protein
MHWCVSWHHITCMRTKEWYTVYGLLKAPNTVFSNPRLSSIFENFIRRTSNYKCSSPTYKANLKLNPKVKVENRFFLDLYRLVTITFNFCPWLTRPRSILYQIKTRTNSYFERNFWYVAVDAFLCAWYLKIISKTERSGFSSKFSFIL